MRATHTVQHEVWSAGPADGHGNVSDMWAEPTDRPVYGWSQRSSSEPKQVGANRLVVDLEMFSPWGAATKDRVTILGRRFEVVGESEDWNHGPFGWHPGFVVNLVRIDG